MPRRREAEGGARGAGRGGAAATSMLYTPPTTAPNALSGGGTVLQYCSVSSRSLPSGMRACSLRPQAPLGFPSKNYKAYGFTVLVTSHTKTATRPPDESGASSELLYSSPLCSRGGG